jgi:hypothetical protein
MFEYTAWEGHRYLRSPSRSLLPESVRREIADLNGQYLAAINSVDDATPFCWRGEATPALRDARLLETMAACPFTLFELRLDELTAPVQLSAAGDDNTPALIQRRTDREALTHSALTLAWRLAESSPFSMRLALGLSAAAELLMNEARVTSLATWARRPGLLRTRWLGHPVFWSALLRAAELGDAGFLARTHCLGITLLVGQLGSRPRDAASSVRVASRCAR